MTATPEDGAAPAPKSLVARTLAERVRAACEATGLSQHALALEAEVSQTALSRLLRGQTEPARATVERLYAALERWERRLDGAAAEPKQGLARLSAAERTARARAGALAAHKSGNAHVFTAEDCRRGGVRGGAAFAGDSARMSAIGREGVRRRWARFRSKQAGEAPPETPPPPAQDGGRADGAHRVGHE